MDVDANVDKWQGYLDTVVELGLAYLPKVFLAAATLFIGFWLVNRLAKAVGVVLGHRAVDDTLRLFLVNFIETILKVMLVISVAGMIGVETTSFIAVMGAAGLAVGLALQGSLGNFAGGVLILFFKPYRVGDVIETQGFLGKVEHIQIFNTILLTPDNQKVIIPNGLISNGSIKNIFAQPERRMDIEFGISYNDDIEKARQVILSVVEKDDRILRAEGKTPAVFVSGHADSSVTMLTRVWMKSEDYWGVHFDLFEKVKIAFDDAGISIPFPQRDVHLHQAS